MFANNIISEISFIKCFCRLLTGLLLLGVFGCSASTSSGGSRNPEARLFTDEELALEEQRWADGGAIPVAAQAGGFFADIHFDFDSATVPADARSKIQQNAEILAGDSSLNVEVEGHCDSRGTNVYNLALGEERARAVASLLVSYGVSPSQVNTISYGEEIPLNPDFSDEAFQENRRVHFAVFRKPQAITQ